MEKYSVTVVFTVEGHYLKKVYKFKRLNEAVMSLEWVNAEYGKHPRYVTSFIKQIPRQLTWD